MEIGLFHIVSYAFSVVLLTAFSGAFTALEVLSLGRDDNTPRPRLAAQLARDSVTGGIAISLARSFSALLVVICSIQLGTRVLSGTLPVAFLTAASLLVPGFVAKVLAVRGAERFLRVVTPLVLPVTALVRPVALSIGGFIRGVSPGLVRLLSFQVVPLKNKIEMFGVAEGSEVDEEQRIMSSIMEFGETRVREVMVPRIDIVAVDVTMDKKDALARIMEAGHSRVPVYEETVDRILGTIYTKDLLRKISNDEDYSLRALAREAFFVPESKLIDDLLSEFKVRKQHLAIVVDEYGGTAGIVTLEDVLEELVGDIQDEFDTEEELLERIDDDTVICNAKIRVDELNEVLGLSLSEDPAESLGGLLYHMIGHVPAIGDTWSADALEFEVQSVERQRIDKVLIRGLRSRAGQSGENTGGV